MTRLTIRVTPFAVKHDPWPRGARGRLQAVVGLLVLLLSLATFPAAAQEEAARKDEASPEDSAPRVVNINSADAAQLALLPRVGPALAQRILDFRQENGDFEAPEELILVRGIGEKTFELLEPYVTVKGKTTLTEKVRGVS
jgi:competence protein ComEA